MAVQKFRAFDDARQAPWLSPEDPRILERMRHLARMVRPRRPIRRGITCVRTIEEAKRDKGTAWQVHVDP